jgi:hypothetical protein
MVLKIAVIVDRDNFFVGEMNPMSLYNLSPKTENGGCAAALTACIVAVVLYAAMLFAGSWLVMAGTNILLPMFGSTIVMTYWQAFIEVCAVGFVIGLIRGQSNTK